MTEPTSNRPGPPGEGDLDTTHPIDAIEFETTMLVRNFELSRRRGDLYVEVDRSGYLLLRTLHTTGPVDIVTLATILGLETSTAARQVAAMHHAGLVTRNPAPGDRRRSVTTPTEQGYAAMTAVLRRRREATQEMLADWSWSALEALGATFARYNKAITDRYLPGPDARHG